jgi:hypothetical protein
MDDKKDVSDEKIYMQQVDPHNPPHVYVSFTIVHMDFGKLPNIGVMHSRIGYIFFCENGTIA